MEWTRVGGTRIRRVLHLPYDELRIVAGLADLSVLPGFSRPPIALTRITLGAVSMKSRIKPLVKRVLPQSVLNTLRYLWFELPRASEKRRTQRIFASATVAPSYLDISVLETLQLKYPPLPEHGYDAHALAERGLKRASQILQLPGSREAQAFLELGCWDGMVSCCLRRRGKKATAIDYRDTGFDQRAAREGVELLPMDASDLRFEDESFDFVFSYDAFEHFASPEAVLREAVRVVRTGGYIHLEFGPLYYSPYGEHAYRSITVPYCQFLFPKHMINDFAIQKGLEPIDFAHVNGWSLENYRALWSKYARVLKRVRYHEQPDLAHLDLIRAYPGCFKNKSENFENFIVGSMSVLFQKTHHELP